MSKINQQYERLAFEQEIGQSGNMLSGWQCENPFIEDFISAVKNRSSKLNYKRYVYFDENDKLVNKIIKLHKKLDGIQPDKIICGSGSTALLFAFITHLKNMGVKKVYYISPIYFTIIPALDRYGIRAVPISKLQPYENGFQMELPAGNNNVLLLSDPIWYTGTRFPLNLIQDLLDWQNRTSSYVFVDGSLQYLSWNENVAEASALLNPNLTFRLICPTKQLAVNGYRFSYLIVPEFHYRKMAWSYANIYGAASAESIAFAFEAIPILANRIVSKKLINFIIERHSRLRHNEIIESIIAPNCGYFVFEKLNKVIHKKHIALNGSFFDQNNFNNYIKINLLSPSINIIDK